MVRSRAKRGVSNHAGSRAGESRAQLMTFRLMRNIAAALAIAALAVPAAAQTLRVAPHSDLKVVDPIWTSALISVNHGYMVYDTLFPLDDELPVHPPIVDRYA